MREKLLGLLGLMRRANALSFGETNTGACARAGKARLLILAEDASANARQRAEGFAAGRDLPVVGTPFTKEELAGAVGLSGGSMAAVTDPGFALALLRGLEEWEPERFGGLAAAFEERQVRRGNTRNGKRRTNG